MPETPLQKFSLKEIEVISFDLDDTLWNGTQVLIKAEKAMQSWMAKHTEKVIHELPSAEMRSRKIHFIKSNPHLIHQVSQARELFLEHLFNDFGYENSKQLAKECFAEFFKARQQVQFFDGVLESLNHLKKHVRLIAITNGNADLQSVGLGEYFEFCLNAEDFNKPKPHGDIFQDALSRTNILAHQCLHVGDHPVHDMQGAFDAGMHTCWLKDGSREWKQDFSPNLTIQTVEDLAALYQ